ncbi:MAG: choice-of-anchor B family protein [Blastocatellia bacterium]
MSKTHRLHLVAAIFAAMFVLSSTAPVYTQVAVRLLGQLDPFEGEIRYGDVWGEGHYAYLASFNGTGVMIFDISDPANPKLAGHYNPSEGGRFQDVVVVNGIGYFSSENRGGLHIVDVRNPANPVLLSQINEDKRGFPNVHEIFLAEGILYEADSRTNRVKVFDVRDPRAPVFVRDIDTNDPRVHAAIVNNGRLFTSGLGGKTDIYDVRRVLTEQPAHLGTVDSGTGSHSTWVSNDGKILAVARETSNGDVRVFDISNPASPTLASTITAQSLGIDAFSPHNPYIVGNLLFVSWYQAGLIILDITNPSQPRLAGSYDTYAGTTSGFRGCWGAYPFLGFDRVLLSDMDGGLYIVDATAAVVGPRTVSSASYGVSAIAPKSIVAAFGSNLASVTQIATSTPLPTSIAGTSITVQDLTGTERLAPLFFVSANQINYQIPAGTTPGSALLKFTNAGQTTLGSALIAASAPSIFTMDASGNGAAAALDAFTFTIGPFNATRSGGEPNVIAIFGTGFGADATDVDANVNANVQATIDGQPVTVLYAGRAPGFVGLNQTNIMFPAGITPGVHRLVITRNGVSSNQVTIAVR